MSKNDIVRRFTDKMGLTLPALEMCKKWLLEYSAANDMSMNELDEICFEHSDWLMDNIFIVVSKTVPDNNKEYPYLSTLNCFDLIQEKVPDLMNRWEEELRWYEENATDEDIGEGGENLSRFLTAVGFGNLEELIDELCAVPDNNKKTGSTLSSKMAVTPTSVKPKRNSKEYKKISSEKIKDGFYVACDPKLAL